MSLVISTRQMGPLHPEPGHNIAEGHNIKGSDVQPQSRPYVDISYWIINISLSVLLLQHNQTYYIYITNAI